MSGSQRSGPAAGFPPVCGTDPALLILGSFPSVRSRAEGFYYGHPQNRFWRVLSALLQEPLPVTPEEKRRMLLAHRIALWDVAAACEVTGSADASLREVTPNDVAGLLREHRISRVYTNGRTAEALYRRFILPASGVEPIALPSTSPANAAWSLDRLLDAWRVILTS